MPLIEIEQNGAETTVKWDGNILNGFAEIKADFSIAEVPRVTIIAYPLNLKIKTDEKVVYEDCQIPPIKVHPFRVHEIMDATALDDEPPKKRKWFKRK